jgi:predicted signal transduction protein with EAL and GGDEF domain
VNDTLGHEAGDEVLTKVARQLEACLRDEDIVARLGGDEFGVLLEEDLQGASFLAERLTQALQSTWSIASGDVPVAASIGVAARQHEEDLDQLLRQADAAMYAAKAAGKGRWHVFTPDLDAELAETRSLHAELQRAVERQEFVIHYQPVVDLRTGVVEAVEALVRWEHPDRGLLVPAAFLPEAEEGGQIVFIDRWVVREACRQVREWQRTIPGAESLAVHVNLSARQLQFPGLADEISEALDGAGLRPEDLVLEVTETTLVRDAETAAAELQRLKELHVQLALDDFGTGFSSLSHLLRFPIDTIKIDRSFVSALGTKGQRSALVPALVNLGHTLRLRVVAEGIEDAEQLTYLRSSGCELGQGYYFARPLTADDVPGFLTTPRSEPPIDLDRIASVPGIPD